MGYLTSGSSGDTRLTLAPALAGWLAGWLAGAPDPEASLPAPGGAGSVAGCDLNALGDRAVQVGWAGRNITADASQPLARVAVPGFNALKGLEPRPGAAKHHRSAERPVSQCAGAPRYEMCEMAGTSNVS
jgi:hypothetical protein